jgi:DNA-binding HxlR family transcriptional regulator
MNERNCPVEITLDVIGGKWKALILFHLQDRTLRFSEFSNYLPTITPKMLAQQLRELESDGILNRKVYPQVPPKVEYSLTNLGASLTPILEAMRTWGDTYRDRMIGGGRSRIIDVSGQKRNNKRG